MVGHKGKGAGLSWKWENLCTAKRLLTQNHKRDWYTRPVAQLQYMQMEEFKPRKKKIKQSH